MKINNGIEDDKHLCRKLPLELKLETLSLFVNKHQKHSVITTFGKSDLLFKGTVHKFN